jgi:hypothetical protein
MVKFAQAPKFGVGQLSRSNSGFCTKIVEPGQAFPMDGFTNGFTALAAKEPLLVIQ